jgi:hypothetical protein
MLLRPARVLVLLANWAAWAPTRFSEQSLTPSAAGYQKRADGIGRKFDDWFSDFWRDIFRDLVQAFKAAQEAKISNYALARNETRWNTAKNTVELVLGANLG